MSRCPSIEEQFSRSRRTALSEFYKVLDIQDRRRLLKECEKMKGVEKYAAIVFPELPPGCGLDRALWAFSDFVEGSAVYIVQLCPLIVPICIALTWLTAKHVGVIAALLVGALSSAAMFWAEGTVRERSVLRRPAGALKAHTVGRHAVGKAKQDKNGKAPSVAGSKTATSTHATLSSSTSQARADAASAVPPATLGRTPSASRHESGGSAQALQELSSGLRTLTASLYGAQASSQLVLGSLQDCHSHLTQIATEVGIPGPADASYAALRSSLSALRNAVGC